MTETQWVLVYWLGLPTCGFATGSVAFSTEEECAAAHKKMQTANQNPSGPRLWAALSANASSLAARKQPLDLMGVDGGQ